VCGAGYLELHLGARARGLGTCWTTHPSREREVADLLEIPHDTVQQVRLSALAFTVGTGFRPALRPDPDVLMRWDGWETGKRSAPRVVARLG
jgi:nitroreductase